jgi:stage III sporulation protein AH
MTVITNKYTLSLVLLVLFGTFFYVAYDYVTDGLDATPTSVPVENLEETTVTEGELSEGPEANFLKEVEKKGSGDGVEFFVEYRLERDRVRSRQIELLQQIVENPNSVAETRQEAQQKLLDITTYLEQELQLENMIIAKGYNDTVLFIQPNQVVAVINQKELTEQDVTIIADIIANTTGHKMEDIIIVPKG